MYRLIFSIDLGTFSATVSLNIFAAPWCYFSPFGAPIMHMLVCHVYLTFL